MASGEANIRQRHAAVASDATKEDARGGDAAADAVSNSASAGNPAPEVDRKPKKTYGRTPDGTVFTVPTTHDMVSQLLDPRQPKNLSDLTVLIILALHILAAYSLPPSLKQPVFAAIFLFWRAGYNIGIGFLLTVQSNHKLLVTWARRWHLFPGTSSGQDPRPWLHKLLKRELETKIPEDYEFEKAPIEYNTWLVFRRVVDLILMCDFVSYCLYAIVCSHRPEGEGLFMAVARWATGIALFAFNLWVKLDAHRVVKDFAWYWGDFFYLIDQELTFDGVFEMAPHPMYSIGYAGYYGISMMAGSYKVLFISICAHLAQLVFLVVVENPHIEKTYDPPQPRKRADTNRSSELEFEASQKSPGSLVQQMPGSTKLDFFRITDYSVILLGMYLFVITTVTPDTTLWKSILVAHAVAWRLWYSIGLGTLLSMQSRDKMFTRHFVKYGESVNEAWRQWKGLYHVSLTMCTGSFAAACWKMYSWPEDWNHDFAILKHVLGSSLIALQMWAAYSSYDELGEFGWFFGDFFFESRAKLSYKSIYRFLNNPERVMGAAAYWGAVLITWKPSIFVVALLSQILTLWFIDSVEKPHMAKIYGRSIRQEAGLTNFIKKSLPPPVKEWQVSVDKVMSETRHFVEEFLEAARPKLTSGMSTMVRDTTALFNKYPARLTITRISPDLAGYNPKHYKLSVEGVAPQLMVNEAATGKEGHEARIPRDANRTMVFEYGAPIKVTWAAPANHSKMDWIGLYMVTDNASREVTEVSSLGRWVATTPGQFEPTADKGILVAGQPLMSHRTSGDADTELVTGTVSFEGDKLWWTQGVFEFRYHHDGKHNVMSLSQPFEVRLGQFSEEDVEVDSHGLYEKAVEEVLLPMVQNCLDRDPDIAPTSPEEPWGSHVERDSKFSRRIVYAIKHMFGIEFAPAVVPADGNVRKLAWRICNARKVLAPYSMSHSRGPTTPVTEKFPEFSP